MEEEPTYVKFFNDGYKLAKFQPDLYERIKESLNTENELDQAIMDGAEQWQKEKERQRLAELGDIEETQEPEQDIER